MARFTSGDEDVPSVRVHLARSGGTRRPCVRLPDDSALDRHLESGSLDRLDLEREDVFRLIIDRETRYARIDVDSRGRVLRGAFENRRLARSPREGENRLVEWLRECDGEEGDPLLLDVLVPGDAYGLRIPGGRAIYDVDSGPRSSLADIANDLVE
ncbi:hypothetical protein ACERIT_03315 [Halopenitus sp. H-Gu1]|uniref:DUF7112 family protein n=1 Tax=Halopenitus sp. H-Gu1 TaxID=3242697 RepID=UPI00359CDEB2